LIRWVLIFAHSRNYAHSRGIRVKDFSCHARPVLWLPLPPSRLAFPCRVTIIALALQVRTYGPFRPGKHWKSAEYESSTSDWIPQDFSATSGQFVVLSCRKRVEINGQTWRDLVRNIASMFRWFRYFPIGSDIFLASFQPVPMKVAHFRKPELSTWVDPPDPRTTGETFINQEIWLLLYCTWHI
jgi:hypothetical protein